MFVQLSIISIIRQWLTDNRGPTVQTFPQVKFKKVVKKIVVLKGAIRVVFTGVGTK